MNYSLILNRLTNILKNTQWWRRFKEECIELFYLHLIKTAPGLEEYITKKLIKDIDYFI
jgi:hypothetical protein